ncbi:hypothetical protein QVD17_08840 [Tagetes erecta]|uniref:Uncharacterized protein n=1 Tax=Tagetes erecta TaxID=13708 RepID=A0AAD8KZG8_TARER|nr:hypothetical protein QVD17_08840 [Tagetes erecta]
MDASFELYQIDHTNMDPDEYSPLVSLDRSLSPKTKKRVCFAKPYFVCEGETHIGYVVHRKHHVVGCETPSPSSPEIISDEEKCFKEVVRILLDVPF